MSIDKSALVDLKSLIGGKTESLNELIESFIEDAAEHESELRQGINDVSQLCRAAHTLKSGANDFGATTLAQKCAFLEEQCKTSTQQYVEDQVDDILSELEVALLELKDIASKSII